MPDTQTYCPNEWKVGSKVVVPLAGMCELTAIREEEILGERHEVIEMQASEEKAVLKVPAAQMESRGVRAPVSRQEMERLLQETIESAVLPKEPPHRRLQRWTRLLRTGGPTAPRRVLWELQRMGRLSRKERDFAERIRSAFTSEVGHVLGLTPGDAEQLVDRAIAQ